MPGVISDPVADLLTRIRNGIHARHDSVQLPHSNLKTKIGELLVELGYVTSSEVVEGADGRPAIRIVLKYTNDRIPAIRGLRRVSRPGLRRYTAATEIKRVHGGLGVALLSTSKGVLTDTQARRSKVGGEVLCEIW